MLIFIDEAWRLLNDDPVSADWLYGALRTLRKRNVGITTATHRLTEIASPPYSNLLQQSSPAKIFLPNPEAKGEHVRDSYLELGLTGPQIEVIARATPRSQCYYISLGSRLPQILSAASHIRERLMHRLLVNSLRWQPIGTVGG